MLHGFGKCAPIGRDGWRSAQLGLDGHAAERFQIYRRTDQRPRLAHDPVAFPPANHAMIDTVSRRRQVASPGNVKRPTRFLRELFCNHDPLAFRQAPDEQQVFTLVDFQVKPMGLEIAGDNVVVKKAVGVMVAGLLGIRCVHPSIALEDAVLGIAALIPDPELDSHQLRVCFLNGLVGPARDDADEILRLLALADLLGNACIELPPERKRKVVVALRVVLLTKKIEALLLVHDVDVFRAWSLVLLTGVQIDLVAKAVHHHAKFTGLLGKGTGAEVVRRVGKRNRYYVKSHGFLYVARAGLKMITVPA